MEHESKYRIAKLRRSVRNRESCDDLTELEAELRRAYLAKELRAQLLEREAERYVENIRKQAAREVEQRAVLEDDPRRRSESREQKSAAYRQELDVQIKQKGEERRIAIEEARREREILAEVDEIREECEMLEIFEKKNELAEIMRRQWLVSREMRQIRLQKEEELEVRKDLENEEYLKEINDRTERAKKLREERLEKRENTMRKIADVIMSIEIHKREREKMIEDLITEDIRLELFLSDEEEEIERKKRREELVNALKEQILFTEECKLRFLRKDREFAEEIMRKIAEDERIDKLTDEARRRMRAQYAEDLKQLIEIRRKIREKEIAIMEQDLKDRAKQEEIKAERMKKDRKRLLQEHASNVAEFVNKNALSEEERKFIQQF
ncbi:meiosis-specific nuclear structural protein 1-like [Ceratina calcarata]|uniref:Meiosis-specific nuclear structural protein 1 n=1 Tax=Ceratina calcarata TaxID=156304 RepID=A0AAJ7ISF4_9HYME|nr:meiosis-specific nuclear structural protein 1-like [Ceratina calcarata]